MNSQFSVARLTPEVLTQIQHLEDQLRLDSNQNIVLIAYSDNSSESHKSRPSSNQ